MFKYNVHPKSKYKKDKEKLRKQHKNIQELDNLVEELQVKDFTHAYKNHKLNPPEKNIWECHIGSVASDWVLVYQYKDNELILILIRMGSHSELFDDLNQQKELDSQYYTYKVYRVGGLNSSRLYFAFDKNYAKTYKRSNNGEIKEYTIQLNNPYIVTVTDKYPDEASGIIKAYNSLFNTNYSYEDIVGENKEYWEDIDKEIFNEIQSRGYDGIIYDIKYPGHYLGSNYNISELITTKDYVVKLNES